MTTRPGFRFLAALVLVFSFLTGRAIAEEATAEPQKLPERVTLVKLVSWAEDAPEGCETDLEGSAPPARFDLRYAETSGEPVFIESSTDALFAAGWGIVNRSRRGYGFEKAGEFTRIDFDVVEELRCSCGSGDEARKTSSLVKIAIDWAAGERPRLTAALESDGKTTAVEPVTINGRLAVWELRFARPLPGGRDGECSSRFFAALGLSEPIE